METQEDCFIGPKIEAFHHERHQHISLVRKSNVQEMVSTAMALERVYRGEAINQGIMKHKERITTLGEEIAQKEKEKGLWGL